jgi:hypothetical protein
VAASSEAQTQKYIFPWVISTELSIRWPLGSAPVLGAVVFSATITVRPYLKKNPSQKKSWWSGMVQSVGPEFKSQYCKKQTNHHSSQCHLDFLGWWDRQNSGKPFLSAWGWGSRNSIAVPVIATGWHYEPCPP